MEQIASKWANIASLLDASRKFSDSLGKKVKMLTQSKSIYIPFSDPLSLDFSSNRWFAGKREENYSDWLSWIIEQLDDPKLVFRLLGIDDPYVVEKCSEAKAEVRREPYVQKGHEEQSGRLDILIRYASAALIAVEVKLGSAESTDIAKNKGYFSSIEEQFKHIC